MPFSQIHHLGNLGWESFWWVQCEKKVSYWGIEVFMEIYWGCKPTMILHHKSWISRRSHVFVLFTHIPGAYINPWRKPWLRWMGQWNPAVENSAKKSHDFVWFSTDRQCFGGFSHDLPSSNQTRQWKMDHLLVMLLWTPTIKKGIAFQPAMFDETRKVYHH